MSKPTLEIYRPGRNINVRAYPESKQVRNLFRVNKVAQLSGKADLVYVDSLIAAARVSKRPYAVLIGGNYWWEYRMNKDKLRKVIKTLQGARVVICLSQFLANFVEKQVGQGNTVALPGGLWGTEHVAFKVNPKRFTVKADYKIEKHTPLVVMGINLAGDIKYKGIPIFLEAVKHVLKKHKARVVCSGRLMGEKKLADEWSRRYGLEFVNWKRTSNFVDGLGDKKWPQLLTSADVFVHPSMWDAWGCVVADAMYSAVPSMVFTGHGSEEVGETPIKLNPNDPTHMANSLDRLLSSISERKLLGESHRREAIVKTGVHRNDFANILLEALR